MTERVLSQTDNGLAKLQQEFNSELIDLTDLALPTNLKTQLQNDEIYTVMLTKVLSKVSY